MRSANSSPRRNGKDSDPWWIAWAVAGLVFPALLYLVAIQKPLSAPGNALSRSIRQANGGSGEKAAPAPGFVSPPSALPTDGPVGDPLGGGEGARTAGVRQPARAEPATPERLVGTPSDRGSILYVVSEAGREALLVPGSDSPRGGSTSEVRGGWKILPASPVAKVNAVGLWAGRRWRVGSGVEWTEEAAFEQFVENFHPELAVLPETSGRFGDGELGLPSGPLSAIYRDRGGRIWVASWSAGIARLEPYRAEGSTASFEMEKEIRDLRELERPRWIPLTTADGLCHDDVNGFAEDARGRLWIATDRGVSILEGDRFVADPLVPQFANLNVKSIVNDREGRVFLGAIGGIVVVHPGGQVSLIDPASGLPQRTAQALFVDSRDRIWAGTWGGGVVQIERGTFRVSPELALAQAGMVGRICEDASGIVWLGSVSDGLWKLDGEAWTRVPAPAGFESIRVVGSVEESKTAY